MENILFGIDFGTTTTGFVGMNLDFDKFEPIGDSEGRPFHSVVVIDTLDGRVVKKGLEAWKCSQQYEYNEDFMLIRSAKRYLNSDITWRAGGHLWTPEMVAEEILKIGVEEIQQRWPDYGSPIKAVLAVPVDFGYQERLVLNKAAERVGIEVLQFVSEPTAALVGSGHSLDGIQNIVVVDWGGGTLDISVLRVTNGKIAELEKSGIRLGGDDIDETIARHLHWEHFKNRKDIIKFDGVPARQKDEILVKSEWAKRTLSENDDVDILIRKYMGDPLEDIIDGSIYNDLIDEDIKKVEKAVIDAVRRAGISREHVDLVIPVGGSWQIPLMKEILEYQFPGRCIFPKDAEWCIAKGAAQLAKETGAYALSKSVGLILSDGTFMPVLKKGVPIDHKEKRVTLGVVDDSEDARVFFAESIADQVSAEYSNIIEIMNAPVQGYHFEPVNVAMCVQKDLALKMSVSTRVMKNPDTIETIYPNLKFQYEVKRNETQ